MENKAQGDIALFAQFQGLRYTEDTQPGLTRRRRGQGFLYRDHNGKPVRSPRILKRIKALVIPPAWTDVWICRDEKGHLQVTGRDLRGRKQYRYHPTWSHARNETKFQRMQNFGQILPKIRRQVRKDLNKEHLSREQILAAVVSTMERTGLRIGNDVYARENGSFGLTTIRNKHVSIRGEDVRFYFKGKSGVQRDVTFSDRRLAKIIRQCQELPGAELFGYKDATGRCCDIGSKDVNDYLRQIAGQDFTAKDFRTWVGTITALEVLQKMGAVEKETEAQRKKREVEVIKQVAATLGNTVAVCRKYYVDPKVFECDRTGRLQTLLARPKKTPASLRKAEGLLLEILASAPAK